MPRQKRKAKERRAVTYGSLTVAERLVLRRTGWSDEFLKPPSARWQFVSIRSAADTERVYWLVREELAEAFRRDHPGSRPWSWWQYEATAQPEVGETEVEALERLGALSAEERDEYEARRRGWPGDGTRPERRWDGERFTTEETTE